MDWQNRNCNKMNRNRSDEFQTILIQFCPPITEKHPSKNRPSKLLWLKTIINFDAFY